MSSKTRKFIGPMSLVAIFAVVGALAAFVVLGNSTAQAQGLTVPPTAPEIVASAAGDEQVQVAWDSPSRAGTPAYTSYSIQVVEAESEPAGDSPDWEDATVTETNDAAMTFATITGLDNGDAVFVRIAATDGDDNTGPYAVTDQLTPAAPTVPSAPEVTIVQDPLYDNDLRDVIVSWEVAVEDNGGQAITGYTVTITVSPADAATVPTITDPTTVTTVTIPDVPINTLVVASVVALNGVDPGSEAGEARQNGLWRQKSTR